MFILVLVLIRTERLIGWIWLSQFVRAPNTTKRLRVKAITVVTVGGQTLLIVWR
ncbi:MAG: hypothetical protein ACR2MG_01385 [Pyrinomonadaceae bacterium]